MRDRRILGLAVVAVLAACERTGEAEPAKRGATDAAANVPAAQCEVLAKGTLLPEDVVETSGLAESRLHPGIFWTHNDSGHKDEIFAVALNGAMLGKVKVHQGKNHDWEDIASGPCPLGSDPSCLYIADTGNNSRDVGKGKSAAEQKPFVRLYVVAEPEPNASETAPAREYKAEFPGEPTDIEALAVLPDGRVYLVTKGIGSDIELLRWPTPLREGGKDDRVALERVRRLEGQPEQTGDRVTGASASPDGRMIAVRSYVALAFYRTDDLLGSGRPFAQFDLDPIGEPQGEAVSLRADGEVVLTSEGPGKHLPGTLEHLRCALPR